MKNPSRQKSPSIWKFLSFATNHWWRFNARHDHWGNIEHYTDPWSRNTNKHSWKRFNFYFPPAWKSAITIPTLKKGKPVNNPNCYRQCFLSMDSSNTSVKLFVYLIDQHFVVKIAKCASTAFIIAAGFIQHLYRGSPKTFSTYQFIKNVKLKITWLRSKFT